MAAAAHAASSAERYRREQSPCSREYGDELARITDDIDDPIAKLRYLRRAIDDSNSGHRGVALVPCGPVRRAVYRLLGLKALDSIVGVEHGNANLAIVADRTLSARTTARRIVVGATAAALLLVPALLVGLALQIDNWTGPPAEPKVVFTPVEQATGVAPESVALPPAESPPEPVAESLPENEPGIVPAALWLADRGPGWELYSNGLRIETTYAVPGVPRSYRVHQRNGGLQPEVYTRPVGILFHTSESDLWPLEPDFAKQLRQGSAGLLRYVQREQSYNYVIDRFGRVYRVIDDDSRAHHAGHAVWARNDEVYLDLNSAFLGVSFESRWEGGRTLPITRAQLIAGRNLTNYLRQRFAIAPEMCVTHGLASISPKRGLIGYHRDWARGFPFAAFGLPDLYAQPPPSVTLFGFRYDAEFLRSIGERWPGLIAADRQLEDEARQRSMTIDALRSERQALYLRWLQQVSADTPADESPLRQTAGSVGRPSGGPNPATVTQQ